jgi:hypothetical protein
MKSILLRTTVSIIFLFFSPIVFGQVAAVRFVVKVPQQTPAEKEVYITGSFNSWHVRDSLYRLLSTGDGFYMITLPLFDKMHYEYKYTLGDWNAVEMAANDSAIHNRILLSVNGAVVNDTVAKWKQPPRANSAVSPQMQQINAMKDSTVASLKPVLNDMLSLLKSYVQNWLSDKPSARIQRLLDRKAGKKLNHAYQQVTKLLSNVMATLTREQKAALRKVVDSPEGKNDFFNTFKGGLGKIISGEK